jgi:hypothetical protein
VSDINSNIRIDFDTGSALAQLRNLQAGLSKFHQTLAEGNLAAANAQKGLTTSLIQSVNATGKFSASQRTVATSTTAFTNALEKNQLSLKQYFRYSAAAATANTRVLKGAFESEREILNRASRDRVKSLQSQYIQLNKANNSLVKTLQILPKTLQMSNGQFTELGTRMQMAAQRQQFLNQLLKQGSTQLLNFGKNMQWAGRQLMVGLTIPLSMLAGYAAKAFRELEQETVNFRRVYGDMFTSDAETQKAIDNIQKIAVEYSKYGIAVKDTMSMASKAAAAGFTGANLDAQVKQANKLAVLGQIDQQKALDTTISLQNAFGLSADQLAKKINFLNAVENQTVVSLDDITTAIPKVAPVIKQLGGSVEDLAFFLTAMKEGGINASEGANALKSGLAGLINPTKAARTMLQGYGIDINGIVNGNAGNLKNTVVDFARALDTLAPLQRARAIETMFGKFQFARLSTLFQNVTKDGSQASRTLNLATASVEELAILSEREMGKVENAVGVKFQAAIEKMKVSLMPIGKEFLKAATPIIEFFGKMFDKFNNLGDGTKKVITIIVGALGLIGPVALMTFGVLANGAANVIKFFALLRGGVAKLNGQTKFLGGGFDYLTQTEIDNAVQSNALHASHAKLISVFNVEKTSLDSLAGSYANAASQARALASSSPGLFAAPGARAAVSKLPQSKKYAQGVLSVPGPKGAGDIQPAMLAPGEAVIPSKQSEKHRGLIQAIMSDQIPGHMAGRIPKGSQSSRDPLFLGMPKSFKDVTTKIANQRMLDELDRAIKNSPYGAMPVSNFGKLVTETTGRSFPVKGVGGVYQQPNGEQVFVKPVVDLEAARAEELSTIFTSKGHGLVAPKQEIKTMMDPTDPTGKRKLAVLVSPYNPKFANPTGKFTKQQMADQLYASSLRGDKDLQTANVSGNMVIDAGTSYAYSTASGKRTQTTSLKSVLEQAQINTLGVAGSGARRDFADSIAPIARKMSADEFETLMSGTVKTHNERLVKTLAETKLTAEEREFYTKNILSRAEEAANITNWKDIHANLVNLQPAKKKPLTAAAIEKRFQEQQLRARRRGHANRDFDVTPLDDGTAGFGMNNFDKAVPTKDSQIAKRAFQIWAEQEMAKEGNPERAVNKWKDKKTEWKKKFDANFTYDPATKLFYTGKEGEKGTTLEKLKETFRYSSGITPAPDTGEFVSDKKLLGPSNFRDKAATGGSGKKSGGLKTNNPKAYKEYEKAMLEHEAENKAQGSKGELNKWRQEVLKANPGMTAAQQKHFFRYEASHLSKTATPNSQLGGRSEEKWAEGKVIPDYRGLNNYLNAPTRPLNILEWNKENNYSLIPKSEVGKYEKAAAFMASEMHPATREQARLVQIAAQLELKAHAASEQGKLPNIGKLRSHINPETKYVASAVNSLMDIRLGKDNTFYDDLIKQKRVIDLATAQRTSDIAVGIGESQLVKKGNKTKVEKFTSLNTSPLPANANVIGGNKEDQRKPKKRKGPIGSKAVTNFIGKADGDVTLSTGSSQTTTNTLSKNAQGRITNQLNQQEKLLKARNNLSQKEIDQALSQYKKRLIAGEQEKAINYNKDQQAKQSLKLEKEINATKSQTALAARKEKVGRYSGKAAGALGGIAMGAAMTGMDSKVTGGLFAASTVAGMLPSLMNPWVAAATAMAAIGVVAWKFNKDLENATKEGINLAKSMSMTSKKLQDLSIITGTVSASEVANRRRQDTATGTSAVSRKFGMNTLGSDFGKGLLSDISKQAENGAGPEQIAKSISTSLAVAITQGVISMDQAKSISSALGEQLRNYEIPALISGNLVSLLGPNGENLAKDPLNIRLQIQKDSMDQQSKAFQNAIDLAKPLRTPGSDAKMAAGTALMASAGVAAATGVGAPAAAAMAIAAAGTMLWSLKDQNKAKEENNILMGAAIQLGVEQVAQNQGMVDSLNAEYDAKLKTAKTSKEIETIEKNRKKGLDALNSSNKNSLDILIKQKDSLDPTIFSNAIKAQTDTMYKEGPMKVFADQATTALNAMKETSFKTTLQLEYASGNLDPITLTSLIKYAESDKTLEANYQVLVGLVGGAEANLALQLLSKAGAKPETISSMVELLTKNPDEFKKNMDAINVIGNMQQEYGVTVDINTNGDEKIAKVKSITDALKNDKTEITKDIITNYAKDPNNPNQSQFQGILDNWQTLVGSAKSITKTMAINFVTAGTDNDVLKAYMVATGITPLKGKGFADQKKRLMPKAQAWLTGIGGGSQGEGSGTGTGENTNTGGQRDTTLDDLLRRLRDIADASIDATKGTAELLRITSGKGITKFDGITQQLQSGTTGGSNREFISFLEGMDKATLQAYVSMSKLKKGVVELLPLGKSLEIAFNEKTIRDYSVAQTQSTQDSLAQRAALIKLQKAGVDNATALEMVSDASLAVAINSKTIDSTKLREMAADANQAKNEIADLNLELQNTAESSRKDLKVLSSTLDVLQQVKNKYPTITSDQLSALASNPAMISGFKKLFAGLGSKSELTKLKTDLEDWVNNLDLTAKLKVKIDAEVNLPDSLRAQLDSIGSKMQSYFSLAKAKVEASFRSQINPATNTVKSKQDAVDSAQTRLDIVQGSIDAENKRYERQTQNIEEEYRTRLFNLQNSLNDQNNALEIANQAVEKAQKEISDRQEAARMKYDSMFNKDGTLNQFSTEFLQRQIDARNEIITNTIDKPIETLQNLIDQAQRRIEINFTRPIDELQKSSDKYADDLTLIDHAAEAINKKYDAQEEALNKISAINDQIIGQQKQQLDLAGAISSGDIGAAAKAMQDIQASRVSGMAKTQQDAITAARTGQINALTGATSGLTKDQIEAKQWEISRQIYALQQAQAAEDKIIFDFKEQIYAKEEERKIQLQVLNYLESSMNQTIKDRQVELDAIALKEIALKPLIDAQVAAQNSVNKAQADYNKLLDEKDTKLKDAEQKHLDTLVSYQAELRAAEDALTLANAELLKAETALAAIQKDVDKELDKIAAMEQDWADVETAIADAELATFSFTQELGKAKKAADDLAASLKIQTEKNIAKAESDLKAADAAYKKAQAEADYLQNYVDSLDIPNDVMTRQKAEAIKRQEAAQKEADRLKAISDQAEADKAEALRLKAVSDAKNNVTVVPPVSVTKTMAQGRIDHPGMPDFVLASMGYKSSGGMIPKYFAAGGLSRGTDTVPAMLTPGEFIMSKYAVQSHGVDKMKAMNNGAPIGESVYNYSVNVNVKSDANPDEIARAVMMQIRQVSDQKIRGNRY